MLVLEKGKIVKSIHIELSDGKVIKPLQEDEREPQAIDRKTRKLFTIYGALHPKSDVDRLYIPGKEGGGV